MARNLIDGQKAGGGSPRQPVIAPDSASSITKLKIVVGLSEGEIEGFGRDDIKLDGTPLSALSNDIICDYRFGTNSQAYIAGVDEVANEIGVGIELSGSIDWVKQITNSDIDHVGIRLRWGPLQTSHSNGDISGVTILYEIYIAAVGGSSELVLSTTLSDKTSDSYERYHEFKLPESDNGWIVKVVRVTPSASSSLISDKMYVQAYSEIIKSKFTFPYTSLVYLEYDAKMFSNIAKLAVNAKGLIIRVPSNYNPVTREYSGLWDGTFKMAYSNNPAWVYYDLVTNPRYGCGDRIDQSMVDKWSLYRLAQYCDQMVDDGYGGLEPRFTCNIYLQSKERAYDVLNRLTGLFRAINFWNGAQIVADADIPQDTSYLYTNANVVDGLFEYAGTAATDLYSAAKVAWDNPANGYNTEYEAVSYEHLVKKLGFKVLELDAWGCTSRGQALRAGRWALLAETDTVTFKVGMDGYLAMPGKVIEIQDEFYAGKSNGGRVISVSASRLAVTLDRPVETIAGDTISFNTTTGTVKKYNIVSSTGSVVTLSAEVDLSVERMHIWAISSSQLATQKYRILTVKYDGIGEFTISAVEYNASKYEEIDSNILFDEPPTSIINPIAQDAVQNVVIDSHEFIYQGLNTVNLTIKWERAVNAVEYLVELKKDDGSWLKFPAAGNNSINLENVFAGSYIARVTAVSAFELKSLPTYSVKTVIHGKLTAPQAPLNLRLVPVLFGIEFYWDFPANSSDVAVSRIAISYVDPTELADESSFVTYDKAYSDNKFVLQHLNLETRVWFKVKLVDKLGFESPYTAWVNGQPSQDFDKVLDLISGHISEGSLDQALNSKIDDASTLAGEAQTLANQAKTVADDAAASAATQATALQNGITQVTTDYMAADTAVVGQLNAYKTSNDSAVASVLQKAESAISTGATNSSAITAINGRVDTVEGNIATKAEAAALTALTTRVTNTEGVNTSQGTAITTLQNSVNHATTGLATKASSSALTTLNNQVQHSTTGLSAVNTKVDTLKATVESTTGGLATKASSSALDTLSNKVNHSTTGLDAIASKTTVLESNVAKALDVVTINDTRSTNQPPSWYLTNYPRRVVNEFKTQTVIGVGGFFGGTYCNLETRVYYTDLSVGDIIQTATSSVDPSLYVQRRSNGTAAWTAWAQPIKDLRDSLGTKASASAVSTLNTQVTTIDGKVTTQASQLTVLTSDNTTNKNTLAIHANVVNGVKANYMVKMENNGIIGGFGIIQEATGAMGTVTTTFGVNADTFYIGAPSGGRKPFVVTTASQVVDGITYPAGTWINSAVIANATIGIAHINTASIGSLSAISATIGLFKTAPSGKRVEISDNGIRIYGTQAFPLIEIGDF